MIAAARVVFVAEVPVFANRNVGEIEFVNGYATLYSELTTNNKLRLIMKFIMDKSIAIASLVVAIPLLILIGVLIKLDSNGPVFYRQSRYGTSGKEFLIWKFRTMSVMENTAEFRQATPSDPRITRIGHILRRTSLDELPQLINVLNGSMSLVGPRPHPNVLNEDFRIKIDNYMQRHRVKPGMTGLAQINGCRGETRDKSAMQRRIDYDFGLCQ